MPIRPWPIPIAPSTSCAAKPTATKSRKSSTERHPMASRDCERGAARALGPGLTYDRSGLAELGWSDRDSIASAQGSCGSG